jgi:hypothetical protein
VRDAKRASHHDAKVVLQVLLLTLLDSRERERARVKDGVPVTVEKAAANPVCAKPAEPSTTAKAPSSPTSKSSASAKRPAESAAGPSTLTSPEASSAPSVARKFTSSILLNSLANFLNAVLRETLAKGAVCAV